ncbi:MAG: nucleotidyltransferase domain-containing protein [Actinomycetota bacterium]|nr:MAG: hypothetical protein FD171_1983 [Actinomycetota bacterium]MDO8950023.1 nucleotidyltransferase domain-containing protein [Actinomycetota bacterium]MDP3630184.1 nucleotidyltransferase domain-containing protein [Actinomycetota bacterium]
MPSTHSVEDILGNRSRIRVLRVLNGVSVPLNAAQIARRTTLSKPAVATALDDLIEMGLVGFSPIGRATAYWIIHENIYVQEIVKPLFEFELEVPDILESDLKKVFCTDSVSVILFGSYARGDQRRDSDIDVIVVGADEAAKERLQETYLQQSRELTSRYGAPISVIAYSLAEAAGLRDRSPAFYGELRKDGLVVSGLAPYEWKWDDKQANNQDGVGA